MGLDMYLYKKTFVWPNSMRKDGESKFKLSGAKNVKDERVRYIIEEVGYWRKANAIHRWFVENVQNGVDDCGDYIVSKDNLRDLLVLCHEVMKDKNKAGELLPTQEGFFFGTTEYGEWYFNDIGLTIKIIEETLRDSDEIEQLYYHSSW